MKLFKLMLYALLVLVSLSSVNALLIDKNEVYYKFDGNVSDATGNTSAVDFETTNTTGKILDARDYDGIDDHINLSANFTLGLNKSISMWVNVDNITGSDFPMDHNNGIAGDRFILGINGTGGGDFGVFDGVAWRNTGITPTIGTFTFVTYVFENNTFTFYENGVNLFNVTMDNDDINVNNITIGMQHIGVGSAYDGKIDEFSMWNRTLSAAEVLELYASGNGNQYPYTADTATVTFINPVQGQFLNSTNFTLNVSFNINTNSTFSLNNASNVTLGTNQNLSSANLTGIEGLNNISVFTNTSGSLSNSSISFTIDTINPELNVTNNTEIFSYNMNFSSIINVSDTNLATCTVFTDEGLNATCTNESYVWATNGNHTFNVTAIDLAGNTNSSLNNLVLVNPIQFFHFTNSTGGFISNFTFGEVFFNSTVANISTYNSIISLGNNTLLFEKIGFASTNVTFNLNTTSQINLTTNITSSTIVLSIFDRETGDLVTGLTTITLIAGVGFNGSTTTGLINISSINFVAGDYQIIAQNANYNTESIFFTYNNQETLAKDIFMLNSTATDAGTVTVQVTASTGPFVQGAVCQALEWKPAQSAFVSVAEGNTNTEGSTILNIEIGTKLYKFTCSKDGVSVISPQNIVQVSGATIPLVLDIGAAAPVTLLSNFIFTLTNATLNATHQQVTYTFNSQDNLVTEACLKLFKVNGNVVSLLEAPTCVSSSGSEIQIIVDINQTFSQKVVATAEESGVVRDVDEIHYLGEFSFETSLSAYGMHILVPLLFLVISLVLGLMIIPSNIYISLFSMLVGVWFTRFLVPSVMSLTSTIFITVLVLLMLWGSFRR